MAISSVFGQRRIKRFFEKALENQRLSHAYLFVGAKGTGKEAMALEVTKALLSPHGLNFSPETDVDALRVAKLTHPDLEFIFPAPAKLKDTEYAKIVESIVKNPYLRSEPWAKASIPIARIRELRRKSSYKSYEGKGRVVILADCEMMTTEAANSLLKLLEEPPDKMHLFMISSRPNLLLPTITSRCQMVKFDPLPAAEIEKALMDMFSVGAGKARITARLANGSFRKAVELLEEDVNDMELQALEFFRKAVQNEFIQICYVDKLLSHYHRDLKRVKDLLMHLAFWFRDAVLVQESVSELEKQIIHQNHLDVLKNFTRNFPKADLQNAVTEIEKSFELIDRNVQIQLILIVLLNKLRKLLRR